MADRSVIIGGVEHDIGPSWLEFAQQKLKLDAKYDKVTGGAEDKRSRTKPATVELVRQCPMCERLRDEFNKVATLLTALSVISVAPALVRGEIVALPAIEPDELTDASESLENLPEITKKLRDIPTQSKRSKTVVGGDDLLVNVGEACAAAHDCAEYVCSIIHKSIAR